MFSYFDAHPLFSPNTTTLSGPMAGLFHNDHIGDLLSEGYRPTEWNCWDRGGLVWDEEAPHLRDPEETDVILWRDARNRLCQVTFMGSRIRHKDWRTHNSLRRKANRQLEERLRQARRREREVSFTYLLHTRAEEKPCKVAQLLITHLRFATFEDPGIKNRWNGELGLLKQALEWEGFPFRGWDQKDPATFATHKWQSFWEWWTEHVHPRL
jgi:hypothetical protein